MGFRLVPKSVTLNDLEHIVMAIILRYFAEFGRLHGQFRTSGWLAVDLLFVTRMWWSTPSKHDGRAVLFAVAELFVSVSESAVF